ncbi:MAG: response regulator [Nitrospirota bacterium]
MGQYNDLSGKGFKCLIADDSEFARKNIAKIVSGIGGNVIGEARNGMEAVELYFKLAPDIMLLDITMPELDGVETLRRIIEKDSNAKVIIVSSIGHKEMVWKAICLGAKHYITKPYNPSYAGMVIKSVFKEENGGQE